MKSTRTWNSVTAVVSFARITAAKYKGIQRIIASIFPFPLSTAITTLTEETVFSILRIRCRHLNGRSFFQPLISPLFPSLRFGVISLLASSFCTCVSCYFLRYVYNWRLCFLSADSRVHALLKIWILFKLEDY